VNDKDDSKCQEIIVIYYNPFWVIFFHSKSKNFVWVWLCFGVKGYELWICRWEWVVRWERAEPNMRAFFPLLLSPWTKSNSWESCWVTFHNWNSNGLRSAYYIKILEPCNVHMSFYIYWTFYMWNQISACFIFTWPEKLYPFLSAIYLDLVSYLMEPTGTGQVNVTCPVGSTLSWSAEFKHRNISARRLAASQRPLSKGGKTVMNY
jgi:hypothetical protein